MNLLDEIVCSPDPRLSEDCAPIEKIDEDVKALAEHMLDVMYAAEGCGLAGPQIGEMRRIVVIDVDYGAGKKNPYVLINPEVLEADGEGRVYPEGCLSFPGVTCEITRPSHVVVEALNLDGALMRYEAEGNLMAVCLQHEIDHVNGRTMVDHLGPLARARALRDCREAMESGARPGDTASDLDEE